LPAYARRNVKIDFGDGQTNTDSFTRRRTIPKVSLSFDDVNINNKATIICSTDPMFRSGRPHHAHLSSSAPEQPTTNLIVLMLGH
jgi:hypothetical protein